MDVAIIFFYSFGKMTFLQFIGKVFQDYRRYLKENLNFLRSQKSHLNWFMKDTLKEAKNPGEILIYSLEKEFIKYEYKYLEQNVKDE